MIVTILSNFNGFMSKFENDISSHFELKTSFVLFKSLAYDLNVESTKVPTGSRAHKQNPLRMCEAITQID